MFRKSHLSYKKQARRIFSKLKTAEVTFIEIEVFTPFTEKQSTHVQQSQERKQNTTEVKSFSCLWGRGC